MLRDGAGDSLLSAMTVAVVQSAVETKCALLGKETWKGSPNSSLAAILSTGHRDARGAESSACIRSVPQSASGTDGNNSGEHSVPPRGFVESIRHKPKLGGVEHQLPKIVQGQVPP